jgi:phospholipid transport system substrate-binding protein
MTGAIAQGSKEEHPMVKTFDTILYSVTVAGFLLLVTFATSAIAGPATDAIKRTHESVLGVLHDEELKKPERAADRKEQLAMVIAERFSCTDMARHVLGQQWDLLGPDERVDFVQVFRLLLLKNYAAQIDRYADQYVDYLEERIERGRAQVRTRVIARDRELSLEFWLFERSGDWVVYDVVAEGVSQIQNYRGQIARALRVYSYAELLERMREKACLSDCDVQTARGPSR